MQQDLDQAPGARFSVLGPLAVHAPGPAGARTLPLGPLKRQLLLATLLCHPNTPVSTGLLTESLWDTAPPRTAHKNLQAYVWALRRLLADAGLADRLAHHPGGYVLTVHDTELDALRFGSLARSGREAAAQGDPARAAALLRAALALWQGAPLPGLHGSAILRAESERLGLRRVQAYEDWAEAELRLGNAPEVADTVGALVERHPQRERLRAAQMNALYALGRQSEALDTYDGLRRLLASDLGLDPSPALAALYRTILTGDPSRTAHGYGQSPTSPGHDPGPGHGLSPGHAPGHAPGPTADGTVAVRAADGRPRAIAPAAARPAAAAPAAAHPTAIRPVPPAPGAASAPAPAGTAAHPAPPALLPTRAAVQPKPPAPAPAAARPAAARPVPPAPRSASASVPLRASTPTWATIRPATAHPTPPAPAPTPPPVPPLRPVTGRASVRSLLPPDLADFTGRDRELRTLLGALTGSVPDGAGSGPYARGHRGSRLAVITGPVGTGKTALAVRAAHLLADEFPDGRLLVRMRDERGAPRAWPAVLAELARLTGLTAPTGAEDARTEMAEALREDPWEAAAVWRAWLARHRVLLLLDDAADEAAVRPLVPDTGTSALAVTARNRLAGLAPAHRVDLGPFGLNEALELLARVIGPARPRTDPRAAERIVAAIGLLPLAVRVSGLKLAVLRHLPLGEFAARLADPDALLDELTAGDLDVRTAIADCWRDLDARDRSALGRLGTLPLPAFGLREAAGALACEPRAARRALESLIDAGVIIAPDGEVASHAALYALPRLVQLYARERLHARVASAYGVTRPRTALPSLPPPLPLPEPATGR